MTRDHSFASALTIAVLVGQTWLCSGSVHAEDNSPVAADLVDLALAIPEAVTILEGAENNRKRINRLRQEGVIPDSKLIEMDRNQKVASRKLELLGILVDAELKATEVRSEFLKARHEATGIVTPERVAAAEQRLQVLRLLREACKVPEADEEQAVVHPHDLPFAEAAILDSALVADVIAP